MLTCFYTRYSSPAPNILRSIKHLAKIWRLCDATNQVTTLMLTLSYQNIKTHEAKNERFIIWTRQNNVHIFGKICLRQSDERT